MFSIDLSGVLLARSSLLSWLLVPTLLRLSRLQVLFSSARSDGQPPRPAQYEDSRAGEEALVRGLKQGDPDCFDELFERHASRALAAAIAILRNRQDAEEAVQDAALEAFRSIGRLKNGAAFGGWFIRIVVNRAIDRLRRRKLEWERNVEYEEWHAPARALDLEGNIDMANAVARLPAEHQAIVGLHHKEGYSTSEVARLMNKPEGTVRRRLSESYRLLRLFLKEGR